MPPAETRRLKPILPRDRVEWVESWGMNKRSTSFVYRPSTAEGVEEVLATARRFGRTVALRGAGRSYGDASMNSEGVLLDLTRMNRILAWDPDEGEATLEPGVTIQQLWRHAIEDGWWPTVVPGTMFPTVGGLAAMNVHGKNNYAVGTFGDQVTGAEILLPNGARRRLSRTENADLFHAAIGGFGMLGVLTSLTLKLKRVYSGEVEVDVLMPGDIREMIAMFEQETATKDYCVGWIDCFPGGRSLGRGVIHSARYLEPGEDPAPAQSLRVPNQELPEDLFGVLPKSLMWRLMRPLVNDPGMRLVNWAKYHAGRLPVVGQKRYRQSHAAFAFLLDYVPNWKFAYRPGGLIQYQSFIPAARAADVFERQLRLMQRRGLVSYLGVFKRHRPDPFLLTHGLDGYSLALDFRITESNRAALWRMAHEFDEMVLGAGGRLYFAKDRTMRPGTPARFFPPENLAAFMDLKARVDPEGLLSSDLFRRVFPQDAPTSADARARAAG